MSASQTDHFKMLAAMTAVEFVESGMVVGLGSGSTAEFALQELARKIENGKLTGVVGVPTSLAVERVARELGVPLTTLDERPEIDLTIDGADEVDKELDLIKGGGGALLREKIVAAASACEIIVIDNSKLSDRVGTKFALPVEVLPFGANPESAYLEALGATVSRREADGSPFETDQGNWILDAQFGPIGDKHLLSRQLDMRSGVMAHGLFLGLATDVIVAGPGGVEHRRRE